MHTVLKLYQKAPDTTAWLEYDAQFRMEAAAVESREWSCGDLWQYLACLPGRSSSSDPFSITAQEPARPSADPFQQFGVPGPPPLEPAQQKGKGKRPRSSTSCEDVRPPLKRSKGTGVCRLFNRAPGGCPYGGDCIFVHKCSNCRNMEEHGALACPLPPKIP